MRRYLFQTMTVLLAATLWLGCDKNDDDKTEDTFKLSGTASGAKERPTPAATDATGTLTGTYHTEDNMLDYTITWTNLSGPPIMMHFHGPAGPEETAPPLVTITGYPATASGTVSGMATLTAEQETQLLSGKWYYNIHTTLYPAGEIRAQVDVTAD